VRVEFYYMRKSQACYNTIAEVGKTWKKVSENTQGVNSAKKIYH